MNDVAKKIMDEYVNSKPFISAMKIMPINDSSLQQKIYTVLLTAITCLYLDIPRTNIEKQTELVFELSDLIFSDLKNYKLTLCDKTVTIRENIENMKKTN